MQLSSYFQLNPIKRSLFFIEQRDHNPPSLLNLSQIRVAPNFIGMTKGLIEWWEEWATTSASLYRLTKEKGVLIPFDGLTKEQREDHQWNGRIDHTTRGLRYVPCNDIPKLLMANFRGRTIIVTDNYNPEELVETASMKTSLSTESPPDSKNTLEWRSSNTMKKVTIIHHKAYNADLHNRRRTRKYRNLKKKAKAIRITWCLI